jgi:hypothetical protein
VTLAAVLLASAVLTRVAGDARLPIPAESPTLVVLEGRLGPPAPRRTAAADLELDVDGRRQRFQVSAARILRGSRLGADLLAELSPHRPSLFLRGPEELLRRLADARPEDRVEITGYHRTGSRDLLVSDVRVAPPR